MMEHEKPKEQRLHKGIFDCGKNILANERISSFFRGNSSNVLRGFGQTTMLVMYD